MSGTARLRRFSVGDLPTEAWRNGGGLTRTLQHRLLDGRTAWRVSIADIARDGAFSTFPGLDRQAVLLAGQGVRLRGQTQTWSLDHLGAKATFAGELALDAELMDGPARFWNCMVDRERASLSVNVQRGSRAGMALSGDAALVVLEGCLNIHFDGEPLGDFGREQGLIFDTCEGELSLTCPDNQALWALTTFHIR